MKKANGFTIVEIVAITAVILVLLAALLTNVNVPENQNKAKDIKRLSDLTLLERAINEYQIDNKSYPGTANILRTSIVIPQGSSSLEKSSSGWIGQDLSKYLPRLPTDPINNATYHYSYFQNGSGYELNVKLENMPENMANDGGNDPNLYETGNNLLLISP